MELGILPNTVALAVVAVLGYLFGRSGLRHPKPDPNLMRRELQQSRQVATDLENIALELRRNLAIHQNSILCFSQRITALMQDCSMAAGSDVQRELEQLLAPTQQLASDMTTAYNALREHAQSLTRVAQQRTDALTGLSNRQVYDESVVSLLGLQRRYRSAFALALFDIDQFAAYNAEHGNEAGDAVLKSIAWVLSESVRETDIVVRYGGGEFVVLMPETDLEGAAVLARRVRRAVEQETPVTVSSGLAQALDGDTAVTLLARADKAGHAAKAAGRNCIYQHHGLDVEAVASTRLLILDDEIHDAEATKPMTAPYQTPLSLS